MCSNIHRNGLYNTNILGGVYEHLSSPLIKFIKLILINQCCNLYAMLIYRETGSTNDTINPLSQVITAYYS